MGFEIPEEYKLPLHLFHEGNITRGYDFFGSHFIERDKKKGVVFRVWAPHAASVSVVGDFNKWDRYANPMNKGAFVNRLDYVILASLEVDVHFNCNVVVGSDGVITGAQGGHPDTAQGAKCTIVICPLLQGRIPAICTDVTTVTTPGESVDVVVTDYGVAVNPNRQDLLEALRKADCVPLKTIEELRDIAYSIVGEPDPVEFEDRIVGIIEARDGTIMDVVRQVKSYPNE